VRHILDDGNEPPWGNGEPDLCLHYLRASAQKVNDSQMPSHSLEKQFDLAAIHIQHGISHWRQVDGGVQANQGIGQLRVFALCEAQMHRIVLDQADTAEFNALIETNSDIAIGRWRVLPSSMEMKAGKVFICKAT
jgi:hypothetical protein